MESGLTAGLSRRAVTKAASENELLTTTDNVLVIFLFRSLAVHSAIVWGVLVQLFPVLICRFHPHVSSVVSHLCPCL